MERRGVEGSVYRFDLATMYIFYIIIKQLRFKNNLLKIERKVKQMNLTINQVVGKTHRGDLFLASLKYSDLIAYTSEIYP